MPRTDWYDDATICSDWHDGLEPIRVGAAAPLAGRNAVFVMGGQGQSKRVNLKFIAAGASGMKSQLF